MGYKAQTVGGGPATGLASDWTSFLDNGLNKGSFGTGNGPAGSGAINSTTGIAGTLNDILGAGAGTLGQSLQSLISRQTTQDVGNLRARYGLSGNSFGTPAAFAESQYRAQQAPTAALGIGQLQLSALQPLLQMISGTASKGIPQASTTLTPSPFAQVASALPGLLTGGSQVSKALNSGGNGQPTGSSSYGAGGTAGFDFSQLLQTLGPLLAAGGF